MVTWLLTIGYPSSCYVLTLYLINTFINPKAWFPDIPERELLQPYNTIPLKSNPGNISGMYEVFILIIGSKSPAVLKDNAIAFTIISISYLVSQSICLSLCLYVCLSRLYVCLYACLYVYKILFGIIIYLTFNNIIPFSYCLVLGCPQQLTFHNHCPLEK